MTRDKKANAMASTMVPAKGSEGIVTPKAMAMTAPKEAPEDTPRVEPSAKGFLRSPCMAAPQRDSAAPVKATQRTLGRRTDRIMDVTEPSGSAFPTIAFQTTVMVSLNGMFTLPMHTQRRTVKMVIAVNTA